MTLHQQIDLDIAVARIEELEAELERLRRIADAASEVHGNWCGWTDTGTNRQDFEAAMLVLQARLDGWEATP